MAEATQHWPRLVKEVGTSLSLWKCLVSPTQFYSYPAVAKLTLPRQLQGILLGRTGKLWFVAPVLPTPPANKEIPKSIYFSLETCSASHYESAAECTQWNLQQKAPSFQTLPNTAWLPHPLLAQQWRDPCRRNHLLNNQHAQFILLQSASPWKSVFDYRGSRKKNLIDWCQATNKPACNFHEQRTAASINLPKTAPLFLWEVSPHLIAHDTMLTWVVCCRVEFQQVS